MKKLLKYVLFLAFGMFVTSVIISYVMESLYKETYTGQSGGKINYLLKNYKQRNILAIGDSRCAHHIVPTALNTNVYNLSHNGMSLIFHTGLIDQIVNHEKIQVDTILLHLERDELIAKSNNQITEIQFLKYYYDKNKWIENKINEISTFEHVKYILPIYKWNGKILNVVNNFIKSKRQTVPVDGYVPYEPTSRDSVNVTWSLKKRGKSHLSEKITFNETVKEYLKHTQKICAEKGIKLICFTSPILKKEIQRSKIDEVIESEFKTLNINYLNYWDLAAKEQELQSVWLWRDAHHFNHNGALKFTNILKNDLKKKGQN